MESGRLKEIAEGAGIGMVAGFVSGLVEVDWIRMTIVIALIAYTGRDAGKHSLRSGFTGIFATLALFAGLYIQGNHLFRETPQIAVEKWVAAGFTPAEARALYLKSFNTNPDRPENSLEVKRMQHSDTSQITTTTPYLSDSLIREVDSIKAILSGLLNGENPISQGKALLSSVGLNLFSNIQTAQLCEQLDPGLFEDTAVYFDIFNTMGIHEVKKIAIFPSLNENIARYELATLIHRLICTLESDTLSPWTLITSPETNDNNLQKLQKVYEQQDRKVFPLLSMWISNYSSDPLDAYRQINKLVRRLSGTG